MRRVPDGPINVISLPALNFAAVIPEANARNCIGLEV
jgi:hypothetical protein